MDIYTFWGKCTGNDLSQETQCYGLKVKGNYYRDILVFVAFAIVVIKLLAGSNSREKEYALAYSPKVHSIMAEEPWWQVQLPTNAHT